MRTLGTLTAPSSGCATVAGLALTPDNDVEIRRRIAVMPVVAGWSIWISIAVIFGAALVAGNRFGWRVVSRLFDRERLVAGTR